MHKGFAELFVSIFFLALAPLIANATAITIEPDDYALGADLSYASPYVTLQSVYGGSGPIQATQPQWDFASTGSLNFGSHAFINLGGDGGIDDYEGFGMFFNQEVSHVSLLGLNWGYSPGLGAEWTAFDQAGNSIAYGATAGSSIGETFLVDIQLDGIWSIIIGGGDGIGAVEFDHLTFDIDTPQSSVPEPGSLGLLAMGMTGLGLARRYSRK